MTARSPEWRIRSPGSALILIVPVAARGGWLAERLTALFFNVHRTVAGSPANELLDRSGVLVMPATNSALVAATRAPGGSPLLTSRQPGGNALLTALSTGPHGPPGPPGPAAAGVGSAQVFTQASPAASWVIPTGLRSPPPDGLLRRRRVPDNRQSRGWLRDYMKDRLEDNKAITERVATALGRQAATNADIAENMKDLRDGQGEIQKVITEAALTAMTAAAGLRETTRLLGNLKHAQDRRAPGAAR